MGRAFHSNPSVDCHCRHTKHWVLRASQIKNGGNDPGRRWGSHLQASYRPRPSCRYIVLVYLASVTVMLVFEPISRVAVYAPSAWAVVSGRTSGSAAGP